MKITPNVPANVKQFMRDYRLPITATVGFVLIIGFLVIGRLQDSKTRGQIIDGGRPGAGDYASLFSNDKSEDFVKRDVSADDAAVRNAENKQTAITNSSAITSPSTGTTNTIPSTTTSGGSSSTSGNPIVTPQPFTAVITNFLQDQSPSLQCPNGLLGGVNLNKCSKTYSFAASTQTANGPGTVNYGWQYSVSGSSTGSFVAASGTNVTTLHNQITLSCKNPVSFTAQFTLSSPAPAQSTTLHISHSC